MISFILNDKLIHTDKPAGMALLDFIRNDATLKGTKSGCREGDCGACTVIEGKLKNDRIIYNTIVSCLTPLGNVHGKHIVTIEGIDREELSPIQTSLVEHNGTQCGFCTPGFVLSLTAFLLSDDYGFENARAAIDGNICRCTGYKSIERATLEISEMKSGLQSGNKLNRLVQKGFIPSYFISMPDRVKKIQEKRDESSEGQLVIGGGTDLLVQRPDELFEGKAKFLHNNGTNNEITFKSGFCSIGGEATVADIMRSEILQKHFPKLPHHFKLISSTPVRNMATLAGNLVNASPIADLSIFFLALNADVYLIDNHLPERTIPLKKFFLDYKKTDKRANEIVEKIVFQLPDENTHFNFEKVSKRKYLDIASVNSAISLKTVDDMIIEVHLSAGGVSPVPLYLSETSAYLAGKPVSAETMINANVVAQKEILPISDIRGSKEYKRLLLRQLIFAHFVELFPHKISFHRLLTNNR